MFAEEGEIGVCGSAGRSLKPFSVDSPSVKKINNPFFARHGGGGGLPVILSRS